MNITYHDGHVAFYTVKDWVNNRYGYLYTYISNRDTSYEFWLIADKRNGQ